MGMYPSGKQQPSKRRQISNESLHHSLCPEWAIQANEQKEELTIADLPKEYQQH